MGRANGLPGGRVPPLLPGRESARPRRHHPTRWGPPRVPMLYRPRGSVSPPPGLFDAVSGPYRRSSGAPDPTGRPDDG